MTLLEFYGILKTVGIPVWHYEAEQEQTPYIVYQELTTKYMYASSKPYREEIKIDLAHITKKGLDPTLERLKEVLIDNNIVFTITHGFDEETKEIGNMFDLTIYNEME